MKQLLVKHEECKKKQALFNKLRSYNTEEATDDDNDNPFDGGLNDTYDMDYDNDHISSERIPSPEIQDDRSNNGNDYIQEPVSNNVIVVNEQPPKKKSARKYNGVSNSCCFHALTRPDCRQGNRQNCYT